MADPEHIRWYLVPDPARVLAHTCRQHGGPSYELLLLGGGYLIRRTIGSKTWDTARADRKAVAEWWQALRARCYPGDVRSGRVPAAAAP